MYNITKISDTEFSLIDYRQDTLITGSWELVKDYCEHIHFEDLDIALSTMERNNDNVAHFGVGRRFIYSCKNIDFPSFYKVS